MHRIIMIGMLLLVQACSSGSKQGQGTGMPAWVSSPPADTAEVIYGVGSSYSYNEARAAALKEISGKLLTEISSQSRSEVSQHNTSVSRSANEQISTRTIETQLSNYEVLQSEQVGREIFVQVSMSRTGFIQSTSSRLKEIDDKIKNIMQAASGKTKLQQLVLLQQIQPSIERARSLVMLLQAAGGRQNTDEHLSYYNSVLAKSQKLLHEVKFNVSPGTNLKGFTKHLVALLHNENISATISNKNNADAFIDVNGSINTSVMFSQHVAQMKVTIRISDGNKRVISVREYESSGSSVSDKNNAAEAAVRSLGEKFKNDGVLASLGLIEKQIITD